MDIRRNTPLNLGLYGLATLGTIAGEVTGSHVVTYVCKPLMLVILSSWFFFNSRRVGDRFTLLVQAGLFFSLVGDIALMFQHVDDFNFLIGLGAFMIAQLCYAMGFFQNITDIGMARTNMIAAVIAVGMVAYGYFFASRLIRVVEYPIAIPVGVYAASITLMSVAAAFRLGRTFPRSFALVLIGALFFVLSDSLLAVDRFMEPLSHSKWSVMVTYAIAQVLIAAGALEHVLDPEEIRRKAALRS
jgi:uncharacterized membrane protein YhhN